jgi:N-acetyl-gamma-glutamyl-phosphate reductase
VHEVHKDLFGETNLRFTNELNFDLLLSNSSPDGGGREGAVLFLCLGHGDSKKFLEANNIPENIKIIDLANDFRLIKDAQFDNRQFIYGLPELNKKEIQSAKNIANPGCFATAIQLGLLPLAKAGILGDVYATGITGSTGAGQSLSATSHFSWRANNISAYKTLNHQHINEVTQSINRLQPDSPLSINGEGAGVRFVPWRGDFTRGIYVSSIIDTSLPLNEIVTMFKEFYKDAAFTHVSDTMIDLKQVVNTNKCLIHIEKQGNKIAVHSAIYNLLKGASGQALQNMNLMFGINEAEGLRVKGSFF